MNRIVLISIALLIVAPASFGAESVGPDSERGRFTFREVPDGLIRLDKDTGQVSICGKRPAGWACEAVADDRTALESEIGRLQGENARLKSELTARSLSPPDGAKPDSRSGRSDDLKLPSDADLDRAMAFLDKLWRRLGDIVQNIQRENMQRDTDRQNLRNRGIDFEETTGRPPEPAAAPRRG